MAVPTPLCARHVRQPQSVIGVTAQLLRFPATDTHDSPAGHRPRASVTLLSSFPLDGLSAGQTRSQSRQRETKWNSCPPFSPLPGGGSGRGEIGHTQITMSTEIKIFWNKLLMGFRRGPARVKIYMDPIQEPPNATKQLL